MANTKKNVREEKTEVVEKISIAKNEADAAPAVKAESVPAVTEKAAEANETKKEAPKTEKKRGRKPAAKTEKTPAASVKSNFAGYKSGKLFFPISNGNGSYSIRESRCCRYFLLMRWSITKSMMRQDRH